jgi:ribosomal-protein-alanine N-acetyltransferase
LASYQLAMEIAEKNIRLSRVEAIVRLENAASTRVLERNGFSGFGRANRSMYLHGVWSDQIHYERRLGHPEAPPAIDPCDIQ